MKIDKIHAYLLKLQQHVKAAAAEHKALVSRAENIIMSADALLGDPGESEPASAKMKKLTRLFLQIEQQLNTSIYKYAQDIESLRGQNGKLAELGKNFANLHLKPLLESGTQAKSFIRNITEPEFRKSLNRHFRILREEAIELAVSSRAVRWDSILQHEDMPISGRGIDERIIEFPLAFEAAKFDTSGKILDAGAAMNLPYVRRLMGVPKAQIVHFTQSGDKEICEFRHDRHAYLFGDLRQTDFRDDTFDRVLCISTLEHIGMDNDRYGENAIASDAGDKHDRESYLDAVREMLRILRTGGTLTITVPYGEPHDYGWFQVLDDRMINHILAACRGCDVVQKYYCYENGWHEGKAKSSSILPHPRQDGEQEETVNGVAALLITKGAAR